MPIQQVPKKATYFFSGVTEQPAVSVTVTDTEQPPMLDMIVYSGGIIRNHWFWGNLVIDLMGGIFPKDAYPVLENHDDLRKIGFTGVPFTEGCIRLNPATTKFLDTDESKAFIANSKAKFPYEASIHAEPTVFETIEDGSAVVVNGFTVTGPATVWRQWIFREASVCVHGWDMNTKSAAMSSDIHFDVEVRGNINNQLGEANTMAIKNESKLAEVTVSMGEAPPPPPQTGGSPPPPKPGGEKPEGKTRSLEEARALIEECLKEYPELADEVIQKKEDDGKQPPPGADDAMASKEDPAESEKKRMSVSDRKLAELEKKFAQQAMTHARESAENIVALTMAQMDIPGKTDAECAKNSATLRAKLSRLVPFTDYLKDGQFDKTAFSAAITREADELAALMPVGDPIMGFSSLSKVTYIGTEDEDAKTIDRLYRFSAQTQPKENDSAKVLLTALAQFAKQAGIGG